MEQNEKKQKPRVKLVGEDGNAFSIIGRVRKTLIQAGQPEKAEAFMKEAKSGDYAHLLATVCKFVDFE